jgi:hypothetical protein
MAKNIDYTVGRDIARDLGYESKSMQTQGNGSFVRNIGAAVLGVGLLFGGYSAITHKPSVDKDLELLSQMKNVYVSQANPEIVTPVTVYAKNPNAVISEFTGRYPLYALNSGGTLVDRNADKKVSIDDIVILPQN